MSIKQRLSPNSAQAAVMVEHCQHTRFLYNIGLEQRSMWRRDKHDRGTHPEHGPLDAARVNMATQMRELTALRADLDWLRAGSTVVQQGALRDLDRAFANFFTGRGSYPKFKRRDDRAGGFVVRDLTITRLNRKWGTVVVPKVGAVRFRLTRAWADVTAATSARVTLSNGHWHIAFTTPPPAKRSPGTGAVVGIDRGVANTIATSEGEFWHIPGWTDGEQRRFLALEQRLARQTRTAKRAGRRLGECANRGKTLDQLAALRRTLDNRRTDWVERATTALASTYDVIVIENLQTANMVRAPRPKPDPAADGQPTRWLPNGARAKAALNRAIHASRWSAFATRLDHKTHTLLSVPAAYSSQECRKCGHISSENRESQAVFACTNPTPLSDGQMCGHTNHADTNAAEVILERGITMPNQRVDPVDHQPGDTGGSPVSAAPVRRRNHQAVAA